MKTFLTLLLLTSMLAFTTKAQNSLAHILPPSPYDSVAIEDIGYAYYVTQRVYKNKVENSTLFYYDEKNNETNLFQIFLSNIKNRSLSAFTSFDFSQQRTFSDIEGRSGVSTDTIYYENKDTGEKTLTIKKSEFNLKEIDSYLVRELHIYNKNNKLLQKRTVAIAPVRSYCNPYCIEESILHRRLRHKILFWIYYPEFASYIMKDKTTDKAISTFNNIFFSQNYDGEVIGIGSFRKKFISLSNLQYYVPGIYSKDVKNNTLQYTDIDIRDIDSCKIVYKKIHNEGKNYRLFNPLEREDRQKSLTQLLMWGVKNHSFTLYESELLENELSIEELNIKLGVYIDTTYDINQETGERIPIITKNRAELSEIKTFKIKELHLYKAGNLVDNRVISICPVREYYTYNDWDMKYPKFKDLFWTDYTEVLNILNIGNVIQLSENEPSSQTFHQFFFNRDYVGEVYKEQSIKLSNAEIILSNFNNKERKNASKYNVLNIEKSISFLEKAYQKEKTNLYFKTKLVSALLKNAEKNAYNSGIAMGFYKKAISIDNKNAELYIKAGDYIVNYSSGKKVKEALEYYTQASEIFPNNGELYYKIVNCYKNDTVKQIEYLKKVIKQRPNFHLPYWQLHNLYVDVDIEKATGYLIQHSKIYKSDMADDECIFTFAMAKIAERFEENGEIEKAIKYTLIQLDFTNYSECPSSYEVYHNLGFLYLKKKDRELSYKYFKKGLLHGIITWGEVLELTKEIYPKDEKLALQLLEEQYDLFEKTNKLFGEEAISIGHCFFNINNDIAIQYYEKQEFKQAYLQLLLSELYIGVNKKKSRKYKKRALQSGKDIENLYLEIAEALRAYNIKLALQYYLKISVKNTTELDISRSGIREIPAGIFNLVNIEILDLSHNKITILPNEIKKLTKLKKIYLSDNYFSKAEQERIKKLLPENCILYISGQKNK